MFMHYERGMIGKWQEKLSEDEGRKMLLHGNFWNGVLWLNV